VEPELQECVSSKSSQSCKTLREAHGRPTLPSRQPQLNGIENISIRKNNTRSNNKWGHRVKCLAGILLYENNGIYIIYYVPPLGTHVTCTPSVERDHRLQLQQTLIRKFLGSSNDVRYQVPMIHDAFVFSKATCTK
jgi:hypothetical protein